MAQFIGRPATVECSTEGADPVGFSWNGGSVQVVEILAAWHDYGFGGTYPSARTWRTRRHRNYFRMLCDDGHTYEIYLDRASGRRDWQVYRRLD